MSKKLSSNGYQLRAGDVWGVLAFSITCFVAAGIVGATLPWSTGVAVGMGILGGISIACRYIAQGLAHKLDRSSVATSVRHDTPAYQPASKYSHSINSSQCLDGHIQLPHEPGEHDSYHYGPLFQPVKPQDKLVQQQRSVEYVMKL